MGNHSWAALLLLIFPNGFFLAPSIYAHSSIGRKSNSGKVKKKLLLNICHG